MSRRRSPIEALIRPRSIVIFVARPNTGSMGGILTTNLKRGAFSGRLHLLNPKHEQIGGRICHPDLATIDSRTDLALTATLSETVSGLLQRCGNHQGRAAIIYSAGFAETDGPGQTPEAELMAIADRHRLTLFGPRAVGFVRPSAGIDAIPFKTDFPAGGPAFVSQSGAVCTGLLDCEFGGEIALSAVCAPGNACDLDLPEIRDYPARDMETRSILLYLEGALDQRRFMSALRVAARFKPVVIVMSGCYPASARVAAAHQHLAVGDDEVFDAALRRAGALRVRSIGNLFSAARPLLSRQMPRGSRLAIVTNGGGPVVVAADAAAASDVHLVPLGADATLALASHLPASWSMSNPVEVLFMPMRSVSARPSSNTWPTTG